jgi:Zinc finger protein
MDEDGVRQAIIAAERNEMYFSRLHKNRESDQRLWEYFKSQYLWASSKIMEVDQADDEKRALPTKFMEGWEIYRKEKVARNP